MKLLKVVLALLAQLCVSSVAAQTNLIYNGSFEEYSQCPSNLYEFYMCNNTFKTTDMYPNYFLQCSYAEVLGISTPQNLIGFQNAKQGLAYFGIATLFDKFIDSQGLIKDKEVVREYIQMRANTPLETNTIYYLSMYVSAADSAKKTCYYYTHNIGAYFSADKIDYTTTYTPCMAGSFCGVLPFTPQIENRKNKQALNSITEWIKVDGYFTASGGEQYITIGNFRSFDDTEKEVNPAAPPLGTELWNTRNLHSFYYIDDVSLIEIGPVGMVDEQGKIKVAYYNTSTNTLNVSERGTLVIYNMQGVKVKELLVKSGEVVSVSAEDLGGASGVYVWQLQTDKDLQRGKIIISE